MTDPKILRDIADKACIFDRAHFDDDIPPTPDSLLSNHERLPSDRKLIARLRPRYAVALGFFEGYAQAVAEREPNLSRDAVLMDLSRTRERILSLAAFANATEVRDRSARFVSEAIDRIAKEGRNIGIVIRPPPPPPPPAAPPIPNDVPDELLKAAIAFANETVGEQAWARESDIDYARTIVLDNRGISRWTTAIRWFVEGARWQLARIERTVEWRDRLEQIDANSQAKPAQENPIANDELSTEVDDDVQAGSRGLSLQDAIDRYASDLPTPTEISEAWFDRPNTVSLEAACRVLALFMSKRKLRELSFHEASRRYSMTKRPSDADIEDARNWFLNNEADSFVGIAEDFPGSAKSIAILVAATDKPVPRAKEESKLSAEMPTEREVAAVWFGFDPFGESVFMQSAISGSELNASRVLALFASKRIEKGESNGAGTLSIGDGKVMFRGSSGQVTEIVSPEAMAGPIAPLVFRDENERDFWDEQVHALNRRGDRTPSDVASVADEMVEERRKRMPTEDGDPNTPDWKSQAIANMRLITEKDSFIERFRIALANALGEKETLLLGDALMLIEEQKKRIPTNADRIEEQKKRIPTNVDSAETSPRPSDELLLEASKYANENGGYASIESEISDAKRAMSGEIVFDRRWTTTVCDYVNGALRRSRIV